MLGLRSGTRRALLAATVAAFAPFGGAGPAFAYPVKVQTATVEARTAGGRCSVSINYPKISGLADGAAQDRLNKSLVLQFRGKNDSELRAGKGDCVSAYIASVGFEAYVTSTGLMSLKRTRTVLHGDGFPGEVVEECRLIDLKHGGRIEPTRWLGAEALAKLSEHTQLALQKRYETHDLTKAGFRKGGVQLRKGNFTMCVDDDQVTIVLSPSLVDSPKAVEVRLPVATLAGTPLAKVLGLAAPAPAKAPAQTPPSTAPSGKAPALPAPAESPSAKTLAPAAAPSGKAAAPATAPSAKAPAPAAAPSAKAPTPAAAPSAKAPAPAAASSKAPAAASSKAPTVPTPAQGSAGPAAP